MKHDHSYCPKSIQAEITDEFDEELDQDTINMLAEQFPIDETIEAAEIREYIRNYEFSKTSEEVREIRDRIIEVLKDNKLGHKKVL